MAVKNRRGQCGIELTLAMIVMTTIILGIFLLFDKARGYVRPAYLSKEVWK